MPRHLKRRHFRPIFKSAKLPQSFRLYDLRHSCATLLLAAGEHPKVVSERLGHARAGPITWTVRSKLMTATGRSFGANGTSFSETRYGTCTLAAGTRTVSSTAVAATSRIALTGQDNNVTGTLRVSARSNGARFTTTSSNAADSRVAFWQMWQP